MKITIIIGMCLLILLSGCVETIIILDPNVTLHQVYYNRSCTKLNCLEIIGEEQDYNCVDFGDRYCNIKNNCDYPVEFKVCKDK